MIEPQYVYRATLVRGIDGDTVILRLDLGFRVFVEIRVRIHDVDTPERGEPGWAEATAFTRELLTAKELLVKSYKDKQTFERWVCDVWVGGMSVADTLKAMGHGT